MDKMVRILLPAALALLLAAQACFARQVTVEGILPGAAVLNVDGQRKLLREGATFDGVTLLSAQDTRATVEIAGVRRVLGLSRHIGSSYEEPAEQVVSIARNSAMQYQTTALINGRSTLVMIDTGANVVAMSEAHARSLGVDTRDAQASVVQTASGVTAARQVTLRSVNVGGIQVDNVQASVLEGDFPAVILLGMTYLRHVRIEEQGGILSLSRVR
ncbi:MAG: TIGR02281 family clan AA aspartic protease [Halioglobus sp.]|nr:TIGR02281 family clan AA aspartic protease [Halioglobus sp.]|tara:strand:+ start:860 stop:1507 length:648 start_codon:yes stop_codon:yes gene_type:complete